MRCTLDVVIGSRTALLGCALTLGCAPSRGATTTVELPTVAHAQASATSAPRVQRSFTVGERRLIHHDVAPAWSPSCDAERIAWTSISSEVFLHRFGEASPARLADAPGARAIALSGSDVFAVVPAASGSGHDIVQHRAGKWDAIERDVRMPDENLAADARRLVWVGRNDEDDDALFVRDLATGRVATRALGELHWTVDRIAIDGDRAFVFGRDQMHAPHLHEVDLVGTKVRSWPTPPDYLDAAAADGVLVALREVGEPPRSGEVITLVGAPARSVARFPFRTHPRVVTGAGLACYFATDPTDDDPQGARILCADTMGDATGVVDELSGTFSNMAFCGGKHLVWTRGCPERDCSDLVYADIDVTSAP